MARLPSLPRPGCSAELAYGSPLPRTTLSHSPCPTSSSGHSCVGMCYFFLSPGISIHWFCL